MSSPIDVGGFDEIAQRAVMAADEPGALEEAVEIASKSERIVRPSMAVRIFLSATGIGTQPQGHLLGFMGGTLMRCLGSGPRLVAQQSAVLLQ